MISRQRRYKNARLIVKARQFWGWTPRRRASTSHARSSSCSKSGTETDSTSSTHEKSTSPHYDILESKDIVKVLHNAKFDYKFIKKWAGISMEEMYDTFLAERVINCGKQDYGYSLARCTERYLGVTLDKETRNKFIGLKGQPYTVDQITYGANDVVYLLDIRQKQLSKIRSLELDQVTRLENAVVKVFAEIEYEGLNIDEGQVDSYGRTNVKLAYEQELKLDDMVLEHPFATTLPRTSTGRYVCSDG